MLSFKLRIAILAVLLTLPITIFGPTSWHGLSAASMPDMTSMSPSECLSACGGQLQSHAVVTVTERKAEKEKDRYPKEAEPYYVQFMRFTPLVSSVDVAYFLRHLEWRPPDIISLYSYYRI